MHQAQNTNNRQHHHTTVKDVSTILGDEPFGDKSKLKDATNEGQENINEETIIIDVDSTILADQLYNDVRKSFLLKKKRYAGYTRLNKFEHKIIRIFLNYWIDS